MATDLNSTLDLIKKLHNLHSEKELYVYLGVTKQTLFSWRENNSTKLKRMQWLSNILGLAPGTPSRQADLAIFSRQTENEGRDKSSGESGLKTNPTRSADFWEGRWTDADQRCRELQGVISRALNACLASDSQARAIAKNLKAETEAILSGASGMAVSSAKGT